MDIPNEYTERAASRLVTLAGLEKASAHELVEATLQGAVDQALELIMGSGPVPTAMTTSMADRLRFICERAGRTLSQREVELLFRVKSSTAKAILNTMLATYEEGLRKRFLERMRNDCKVMATGTDVEGLTWTLRFTEAGTLETAWSEVLRIGAGSECERNVARRTLIIPRKLEIKGNRLSLLGELGLAESK